MADINEIAKELLAKNRRRIKFAYHVLAVAVGCPIAFYLRFDGVIPEEYQGVIYLYSLMFLVIRLPLFKVFGMFKGLWRYAGMIDMQKMLASVTVGSALYALIMYKVLGHYAFPRSVIVLEWLLLIVMIGGVRFTLRSYKDYMRSKRKAGKRIMIVGAGNAGEMIVRDMVKNPYYEYDPVVFIDDDPLKRGLTIHGVPIVGGREMLDDAFTEYDPQEILIAIPSAKPSEMQALISEMTRFRVPISTLPNLKDVIEGKVSVSNIKTLELEDLLARPAVKVDTQSVLDFINGKTVMVTGAGGSIGSEICRQVVEYGAKELIAYERHENSMYALGLEFSANVHSGAFRPVVGDIHDSFRLEETLRTYQPDIIFHTAAYKHVPLMENNVMEAVRNNFLGTRNVALQAAKHGVGTFVFISTDKAVNPTNIMGATKRACELLVGALARGSKCTRYLTVRFGNVLGSSGSVVPLFREQIAKGGPVTVTHPDITRFLMLIPEAVLLVLEAASIGKGGETFVLDMGEPIRIVDLARNLIILSGFEPDGDIKIEFVGLRPGEKLYEELFDKSETVSDTQLEKVFRAVSSQSPDRDTVLKLAEDFEGYLNTRDRSGVLRTLRTLVTSYRPSIPDECAFDPGAMGSD